MFEDLKQAGIERRRRNSTKFATQPPGINELPHGELLYEIQSCLVYGAFEVALR
jgi:hypothetical protein